MDFEYHVFLIVVFVPDLSEVQLKILQEELTMVKNQMEQMGAAEIFLADSEYHVLLIVVLVSDLPHVQQGISQEELTTVKSQTGAV